MVRARDVHYTSTIMMAIRERKVERRAGGWGLGEAQPGRKGSLGVNFGSVMGSAVSPR